MKNWSEIQISYPFFWLWLNAWLKKKGAESLRVCYDDANSDYVKVRFNIPSYKERELSEEMMNDVFDEAGVRVCVNFDHEADKQPYMSFTEKRCKIFGSRPILVVMITLIKNQLKVTHIYLQLNK